MGANASSLADAQSCLQCSEQVRVARAAAVARERPPQRAERVPLMSGTVRSPVCECGWRLTGRGRRRQAEWIGPAQSPDHLSRLDKAQTDPFSVLVLADAEGGPQPPHGGDSSPAVDPGRTRSGRTRSDASDLSLSWQATATPAQQAFAWSARARAQQQHLHSPEPGDNSRILQRARAITEWEKQITQGKGRKRDIAFSVTRDSPAPAARSLSSSALEPQSIDSHAPPLHPAPLMQALPTPQPQSPVHDASHFSRVAGGHRFVGADLHIAEPDSPAASQSSALTMAMYSRRMGLMSAEETWIHRKDSSRFGITLRELGVLSQKQRNRFSFLILDFLTPQS